MPEPLAGHGLVETLKGFLLPGSMGNTHQPRLMYPSAAFCFSFIGFPSAARMKIGDTTPALAGAVHSGATRGVASKLIRKAPA